MRKAIFILLLAVVVMLPSCKSKADDSLTVCEKIQKYAKKAEGTPYVWGAESLHKGMDCSGFIYWMQQKIGNPVPRTTAHKYWLMAEGDPKHWRNATCSDWNWWELDPRRPYGHIGIMAENPKFWQSGSSKGVYSRKFFEGSFWDRNFKGSKEAPK